MKTVFPPGLFLTSPEGGPRISSKNGHLRQEISVPGYILSYFLSAVIKDRTVTRWRPAYCSVWLCCLIICMEKLITLQETPI